MHTEKIDRQAVGRAWAEQGFTCDVWVDAPGQVWHDFLHDVDEMVLLLEGECMIEMQGRAIRLQAGDQLLVPAGCKHTVRNTGAGPARWLHGYRQTGSASELDG